MKQAHAVGKNGGDRLVQHKVVKKFQFVKTAISIKCYKIRYDSINIARKTRFPVAWWHCKKH